MSYLHCMTCFDFYSNTSKFYISSCRHVACIKCVERGAFTLKCKICQKENPQIQEIGNTLKKEYRELFTPMTESVREINQMMAQVLQFQATQRKMLIAQLYARFESFEKMRAFCEDTLKKKNEYKSQIMQLQNYNTKAKQHIQTLQQKLTDVAQNSQVKQNNLNLTTMTHDPFRTPAHRPAYRSFITSTPCDSTRCERTSSTDVSLSFTAATGFPRTMNSTDGEITVLAQRTEGVNLDSTMQPPGNTSINGGIKRSLFENTSRDTTSSSHKEPYLQTPCSSVSVNKKSRMDIMTKTDPLHK